MPRSGWLRSGWLRSGWLRSGWLRGGVARRVGGWLEGVLSAAFAVTVAGCSSCSDEASTGPSARLPRLAAAPASAAATEPILPPQNRMLAERGALDPEALLRRREAVLGALRAARKARGAALVHALVDLDAASAIDPGGALVALWRSRALLASGDGEAAYRAALVAVAGAEGRPALEAQSWVALADAAERLALGEEASWARASARRLDPKLPAPQVQPRIPEVTGGKPRSTGHRASLVVTDARGACGAVRTELEARRVLSAAGPLGGGGEQASFVCAWDGVLDVNAPALRRGLLLRVDLTGAGRERQVWVGLDTPQGLRLFGPVARAWTPPRVEWVNDVTADLQPLDVLLGGAPEVIVRLVARRTLADVALGELLEVDETRALMATLDRGGVELSAEVSLASTRTRRPLAPALRSLPEGYRPLDAKAQTASYEARVSWGAPNTITLTPAEGSGALPRSGVITLFE